MRLSFLSKSILVFALLTGVVASPIAYGSGLDKKLPSNSYQDYRTALSLAWQKLRQDQQEAFNWAVNGISYEDLSFKYPSMTVRKVIENEAKEQIARQTAEIARLEVDLKENEPRFEEQEAKTKEVSDELAKIVVQDMKAEFKSNDFVELPAFKYNVKNESRYNISSLEFRAWMFIDDEQESGRYCDINMYLKSENGLRSGEKKGSQAKINHSGCREWDTLAVRNAKSREFRAKIILSSVKDFDENRILPSFQVNRSDYEKAIQDAKKRLEMAAWALSTIQ